MTWKVRDDCEHPPQMAQRTWLVRPDHEVQTLGSVAEQDPEGYGVLAAVSQQALAKAVLDGVVMLDRAGGVLSVTVNRVQTGVPGERVTSGAMVEWKDRTDARPAPERDSPSLVPARVAAANGPPEFLPASAQSELPSELPEVDERDVPPELRGG
jgi:hypothetical protein